MYVCVCVCAWGGGGGGEGGCLREHYITTIGIAMYIQVGIIFIETAPSKSSWISWPSISIHSFTVL